MKWDNLYVTLMPKIIPGYILKQRMVVFGVDRRLYVKKCGQLFEEQVISDTACYDQLKTAKDVMKVIRQVTSVTRCHHLVSTNVMYIIY